MDVEKLFGVYGGVIFFPLMSFSLSAIPSPFGLGTAQSQSAEPQLAVHRASCPADCSPHDSTLIPLQVQFSCNFHVIFSFLSQFPKGLPLCFYWFHGASVSHRFPTETDDIFFPNTSDPMRFKAFHRRVDLLKGLAQYPWLNAVFNGRIQFLRDSHTSFWAGTKTWRLVISAPGKIE